MCARAAMTCGVFVRRAPPPGAALSKACQARVGAGAGNISDDSPEACKQVLLEAATTGWGHGRHGGEMWKGLP
jgi:hypothetical protein